MGQGGDFLYGMCDHEHVSHKGFANHLPDALEDISGERTLVVFLNYGLVFVLTTQYWGLFCEGGIVAVFGEMATIWSQDDVREFERVAVQQNAIESGVQKFEFYVCGSNPENQCQFHILPCEDAELSMEITSSLRHSLQKRSEWIGVGQSANHTCCKRHQNVELQFITVQAMQEDDDGNALTTVKPDVAAVL